MKIVCEKCGAKYSIADEKVAGRAFRIRCKKCESPIVVRGDQPAAGGPTASAAAESAPEVATSPNAIWYVVIDGEQQGPFEISQLSEMLQSKKINNESYVWREGFEGWLQLNAVAELASVQAKAPAGQAQAPSQAMGGVAVTESDEESNAGAAAFSAGGAAAFSPAKAAEAPARTQRTSKDSDFDLFSQNEKTEVATNNPFSFKKEDAAPKPQLAPAPSAMGASASSSALTGVRNESSVLFSLGNLQALATGGSVSKPLPTASTASSVSAPQGTEGSGLIDIRALSSAVGSGGTGGKGQKASVDELLSIGSGSPFSSPLGAPILAPEKKDGPNKLVIGLIAAAVVLAAALVAVVFVVMNREPSVPAPPLATTPTTPEPSQPVPSAQPQTETPPPTQLQPQTPEQTAAQTPEPTAPRTEGRTEKRSASRSGKGSAGKESNEGTPDVKDEPVATKKGGGDIDSLLDRAIETKGGAKKESGGNEALPETPSKDAVLSALRSVKGDVAACADGKKGVAIAAVSIAGSTGRVMSAKVASGPFAGTPAAACIARAVKGAQFPRFKRAKFDVSFPYSL